jgi:hypothetical protein
VITANAQSAVFTASFAANTPGSGANPGSLMMSLPPGLTTTGVTGQSLANGTNGSWNSVASSFPSEAGYNESIVAYSYTSSGSVAGSSVASFTSAGLSAAYSYSGKNLYTATSPETNQQFTVIYTAKNVNVTWYYKSMDNIAQDPLNGAFAYGGTQLVGSPNVDQTANVLNSYPLSSGDYIVGYEYVVASTGTDETYSTWADLVAAHPDIGTNMQSIYIQIAYDQTTLSTAPTDTISVGQIKASNGWSPSVDYDSSTNGDGSPGTVSTVNGSPIAVTITQGSNTIWTGNATDTVPANLLPPGDYTVTYTTAAGPGGITGNTTTTLTVTNFTLPFAGGEGTAGLIGLATAAAGSALLIKKRKKQERYRGAHEK